MATPKPRRRKPGAVFPNQNKQASPAEVYVRELGPGHYMLSEAAELVGIAPNTLRRLIRAKGPDGKPKVKAPSLTGAQGAMNQYIFTDADVEEIKSYYKNMYENFVAGQKLPVGRPRARRS